MQRINKDYFRLATEVALLARLHFTRKTTTLPRGTKEKILITDSCIIGDFMASLPALSNFIQDHAGSTIDLLVSPQLKPLAKRIRGIHKVFVARSVYGRTSERRSSHTQSLGSYDRIIVMRMSKETYELLKTLRADHIETSLFPFVKYGIHLTRNLFTGNMAKQWREVNFEIVGKKYRATGFEELFAFTKGDHQKIRKLPVLKTEEKIVLIHTSAPWIMKKWTNDKWVELLENIHASGKYRFIFIGGSDEAEDYRAIGRGLSFKTYSLITKLDLKELMLLMRSSDYFIGVDSGPRNMAHIADLRSITLLGSGLNLFMPLSRKDSVIDKSNGGSLFQLFFYSPKNHMHKITVTDVFKAFQALIKKR